jgi:nickel-dependent lactate racemase
MRIELPWGETALPVDLPDDWQVHTAEPVTGWSADPRSERDIVAASLADPLGCRALGERNLAGRRILLVVDDNTRPTPVHRFLDLILEELERTGASLGQVLLMPALGIHSPMSESEMAEKVGADNLARVAWKNHDAYDPEETAFCGRTAKGTPVSLNREVALADTIVLVGMVEPHLWAGFGGGLKNLFPGLGSAEAIGAHHGIIAEPPYHYNRVGTDPGDNSFRTDLEEVRDLLDTDIFCLNVVLDQSGAIAACACGDPVRAHRSAVEANTLLAGRRIPGRMDGIVVNSRPMDFNVKQGMKGVANTLPALVPGGTVMAFLKADRGMDDVKPPEKSPPLWLSRTILRLLGPSRVLWFQEKTGKGEGPEDKFLVYYTLQLLREHRLFVHVPALSRDQAKSLGFFTPCSTPEEVVRMGRKKMGRRPKVAVFPEAGATFPLVGS